MQNSNSKLWPSLCSYRLKCISTCMHTWWLRASLCWLSKEHFLHKCDFPSKTCPSSISQKWKYLKAAWRGSILWSVKLLSSGFDWTLCFWGLRHIIRHGLLYVSQSRKVGDRVLRNFTQKKNRESWNSRPHRAPIRASGPQSRITWRKRSHWDTKTTDELWKPLRNTEQTTCQVLIGLVLKSLWYRFSSLLQNFTQFSNLGSYKLIL